MHEYYSVDALNFSFLKFFLNPDPFYAINQWSKSDSSTMYFEEKEHLNRGSLLDCLVTTPELYEENYCTSIIDKKPPKKLMSAIKYLFDTRTSDNMFDLNDEQILYALDKEEFYHSRRKDNNALEAGGRDEQWRIQQLLKWDKYWEFLYDSNGKIILSEEELNIATECHNSIFKHYGDVINNSVKQLAIYEHLFGFNCKGLLDLTHIKNDVYTVIDLKSTSEPLYKIPYLLRDKKWVFQVIWYSILLKKKFPTKKIDNPCLLISSTTEPENPQLVKISDKDFQVALYGNNDTPGIVGAIKNYKDYLKGKRFSYTQSNIW